MDVYIVEMEVGCKIDIWKEIIIVDDKEVIVDMVLFGCVVLVYMDLIGCYVKCYDCEICLWVDFESKYKVEIEKVI